MINQFMPKVRRASKAEKWLDNRQPKFLCKAPISSEVKEKGNHGSQKTGQEPSKKCHFET